MIHNQKAGFINKLLFASTLIATPFSVMAAAMFPFFLGNNPSGDLQSATLATESALKAAGFEIAGNYSPNAETNIIVVTNSHLKSMAAQTENGGFGAMERVAVVNKAGQLQLSYTNPSYMHSAYRMQGDISPVQAAMEQALGKQQAFGGEKGITESDLREYHYMFGMPYFDDEDDLAEFDSYAEAVQSVEAGLAANRAGSKKVYRIDIPGKEVTVFGVALNHKDGADNNVLKQIDEGSYSHAAHFPYEILVVGEEVIALNGKFRIAINWPSLSMGSFMSIGSAPDYITEALKSVARNEAIEM